MKYPVFAIRDVHTGFMSPTVDQNQSAAIRNFEHAVMQSASLMNSHPEHYALYHIGEFDTETGKITDCLPEHLIDASEVI